MVFNGFCIWLQESGVMLGRNDLSNFPTTVFPIMSGNSFFAIQNEGESIICGGHIPCLHDISLKGQTILRDH